MAIRYINQHCEEGILALAPSFWGRPRIASLLCAFLARVQDIEDDLWDILELRTLPLADLVRLKVLGKIVGQPRLTFDLETYRKVIEARARANVSRGRASDMFAVLDILVGPAEWSLTELGNATLQLTALSPLADVRPIQAVLPDVRAAGVGLLLVSSTEADAGVLGFYPAGGSQSTGSFIWDSFVTPGAGTPMLSVTEL